MLDGIREGVQSGLGKVFAVLEPSMAGPSSTSQPQPQPSISRLSSKRHSQQLMKDSFISSGKRTSISTASSGSTRYRSSISGSRSSSSSLFDELSSPESHCHVSPGEGGHTACRIPENDGACPAVPRTPSSNAESPTDMDTEISSPKDDQLSKNRIPGSHSPSPASVTSESLTPLSKQMASWVPPGLNKKWEELKGSET
jgi:hypothetical protein